MSQIKVQYCSFDSKPTAISNDVLEKLCIPFSDLRILKTTIHKHVAEKYNLY